MNNKTKKRRKKRIGEIIRQKRLAKGLLQKELADKAGWNSSYYAEAERGECNPSVDKMFSLADALECDVRDFFKFTEWTDKPKYYEHCKRPIMNYFEFMDPGSGKMISDVIDSLRINIRAKMKKMKNKS